MFQKNKCSSKKKFEYVSKTIVTGGKEISSIPPKKYSLRFQKFISSIIEVQK